MFQLFLSTSLHALLLFMLRLDVVAAKALNRLVIMGSISLAVTKDTRPQTQSQRNQAMTV